MKAAQPCLETISKKSNIKLLAIKRLVIWEKATDFTKDHKIPICCNSGCRKCGLLKLKFNLVHKIQDAEDVPSEWNIIHNIFMQFKQISFSAVKKCFSNKLISWNENLKKIFQKLNVTYFSIQLWNFLSM